MDNKRTISLKLSFNQMVKVAKQLPDNQQQKLITIPKNRINERPKEKKLSEKEVKFLEGLDESVEFVNNYKADKNQQISLQQMLNEL